MNNINYRRGEGLQWQLRHNPTGTIITFTEGRFDATMQASKNDAEAIKELTEWAKSEDFRWISECNVPARIEVIEEFAQHDINVISEAVIKLQNMFDPDHADEYAFEETISDAIKPSEELSEVLQWLTNAALQEMIRLIDTYWAESYDIEKWLEDIMDWAEEAQRYLIRTKIGGQIRELRTAKKMSQEELAKKAGITRANLSNIEAGKYSVGLDILNKIAKALGVEIEINKTKSQYK